MLGDLYQNDVDRAMSNMAAQPVPPPAAPERSAWSAPWRAVKSAAADVIGSVADLAKGYGAAGAMTLEADPMARAVLGDKAIQEGAKEGRRQLDTGEAFTSDVGASFRGVSRDLRPDPATASKAEQIVFGVVRPVAKLVGGGLAMGPAGIVAAAGEEGFTQSDDLREQGVDLVTRTKVGALTAGVTAATAFVPMAGQTLKATAGLYLAGGPGAFVAQQLATQEILKHANYEQLAQQYDPLDPTGLAMSALIPLPFAAHGAVRVIRKARVEPAARVEPVFGEKPPEAAPVVEPAQVEATPHQVTPEVVDAAMAHNLTVHQDRVDYAAKTAPHDPYASMFADMEPKYQVPRESQATMLIDERGQPEIHTSKILLTDAHPTARMEHVVDEANAGDQLTRFAIRDPEGKVLGHTDLLLRDGQIVSLYDVETTAGLRGKGVGAKVIEAITSLDPDRKIEISNIVDEAVPFWEKVGAQVSDGNRSPTLDWHQFAESPTGRSRGAPRRGQGLARDAEALDAGTAGSRERPPSGGEAREVDLDDFLAALAGQKHPEEHATTAAGDAKSPEATVTPRDPAAALHSLNGADATPLSKSGTDSLVRSVADRVAAVEASRGDLVVRTDENGSTVTAKQELERIRREAEEGTDNELGALDADLLQVAADCALAMGSA